MARAQLRYHSRGIEYAVVRRGGRPIIVESDHLEEALYQGAESYPVVCNADFECWLEIPDEEYPLLKREIEWVMEQ